jgi:hypothetical protein
LFYFPLAAIFEWAPFAAKWMKGANSRTLLAACGSKSHAVA